MSAIFDRNEIEPPVDQAAWARLGVLSRGIVSLKDSIEVLHPDFEAPKIEVVEPQPVVVTPTVTPEVAPQVAPAPVAEASAAPVNQAEALAPVVPLPSGVIQSGVLDIDAIRARVYEQTQGQQSLEVA